MANRNKSIKNFPNLRFPGFEGEWEVKKLGEMCKMQAGKFISTSKIFDKQNDDLFPCFGGNGLRGYTKSYNQDGIYSLIGRQGALCGNVTLTKGKFHATEHAIVVTPDHQMDTIWMFYFLTYLNLNQYATGAAQPGLSVKNIEIIEAVFPKIKNEQQKIASFLSLIDKKIQAQSKTIEELSVLKATIAKKIFSRELRFKDEDGNYFPEWEEKKLGKLSLKMKSGGTPKSTIKDYYNGDIPFLSISDMTTQGKYLTKTSRKISQSGLENSSSWLVPKNSLIYSMYASVGFVSINKIPIATSQAVMNIILKEEVNLEYIYYFLLNLQNKIYKFIETGTQGNINAQIVKNLMIKTPSLPEQQKIAHFLSSVDSKIDIETQILTKLEEQKKYFLQNLFV